MFVPHTPHGELARRMKEKEVMTHQGLNIRFEIVEKSKVSLEHKLRRSSPLERRKMWLVKLFSMPNVRVSLIHWCVRIVERISASILESQVKMDSHGEGSTLPIESQQMITNQP